MRRSSSRIAMSSIRISQGETTRQPPSTPPRIRCWLKWSVRPRSPAVCSGSRPTALIWPWSAWHAGPKKLGPPGGKLAVRLRRLQADYERLESYIRGHARLELVHADGSPPERYQVRYQIKSVRQRDDRLVKVDTHLVEITLPLNYPRMPPQCRMLTPIF